MDFDSQDVLVFEVKALVVGEYRLKDDLRMMSDYQNEQVGLRVRKGVSATVREYLRLCWVEVTSPDSHASLIFKKAHTSMASN